MYAHQVLDLNDLTKTNQLIDKPVYVIGRAIIPIFLAKTLPSLLWRLAGSKIQNPKAPDEKPAYDHHLPPEGLEICPEKISAFLRAKNNPLRVLRGFAVQSYKSNARQRILKYYTILH